MALGEQPRIPVAGEPERIIKHVMLTIQVEIRDIEKLRRLDPGLLVDQQGNPEGVAIIGDAERVENLLTTTLFQGLAALEDQTGVHPISGGATVLRQSEGWVEGPNRPALPPPGWDGKSEPPDFTKVRFGE